MDIIENGLGPRQPNRVGRVAIALAVVAALVLAGYSALSKQDGATPRLAGPSVPNVPAPTTTAEYRNDPLYGEMPRPLQQAMDAIMSWQGPDHQYWAGGTLVTSADGPEGSYEALLLPPGEYEVGWICVGEGDVSVAVGETEDVLSGKYTGLSLPCADPPAQPVVLRVKLKGPSLYWHVQPGEDTVAGVAHALRPVT